MRLSVGFSWAAHVQVFESLLRTCHFPNAKGPELCFEAMMTSLFLFTVIKLEVEIVMKISILYDFVRISVKEFERRYKKASS